MSNAHTMTKKPTSNTEALAAHLRDYSRNIQVPMLARARVSRMLRERGVPVGNTQQQGWPLWPRFVTAAGTAFVLVVGLFGAAIFSTQPVNATMVGNLQVQQGAVLLRRGTEQLVLGGGSSISITVGDEVVSGNDSSATITFVDQTTTRLFSDTRLKVAQALVHPQDIEKTGITVELQDGQVQTTVRKAQTELASKFQVVTPTAKVDASQATSFQIAVDNATNAVSVLPLQENVSIKGISGGIEIDQKIQPEAGAMVRITEGTRSGEALVSIDGKAAQPITNERPQMALSEVANNLTTAERKLLDIVPALGTRDVQQLDIAVRGYQNFMFFLAGQVNKEAMSPVHEARTLAEVTGTSYLEAIRGAGIAFGVSTQTRLRDMQQLEEALFPLIADISTKNILTKDYPEWQQAAGFRQREVQLAMHLLLLAEKDERVLASNALLRAADAHIATVLDAQVFARPRAERSKLLRALGASLGATAEAGKLKTRMYAVFERLSADRNIPLPTDLYDMPADTKPAAPKPTDAAVPATEQPAAPAAAVPTATTDADAPAADKPSAVEAIIDGAAKLLQPGQ